MASLLGAHIISADDASSSTGAPLAFLQLVAVTLVAWYGLCLWVWSKHRGEDQPWFRIRFGGWVLLDNRAFQSEGLGWVRVIRYAFLLIVLPLLVVLFWRWPVR
jgi:hypothetical protein